MILAKKVRLYPTKEQEALSKVFGCVRYVYNRMLSELKEAYFTSLSNTNNPKFKLPSHFDMCKHLPLWKKEEDKTDNILYKRHLAQTAKVYYSIKKVY